MVNKKKKVIENNTAFVEDVKLLEVKDRKPLPPGVEHKVLTDEDKKKLKKKMHDEAKSKLNMEVE